MTHSRINAQKERIKSIKKWDARLKKLIKIKEKQGVQEYCAARFCEDYGFAEGRFSRWINLADGIPTQKTVDKVEAAFEAEGV